MSALGDALRAQAAGPGPLNGTMGPRGLLALARVLDAADGFRAWTRGDGPGPLQDVCQTYDAAVADALKAPGVSK